MMESKFKMYNALLEKADLLFERDYLTFELSFKEESTVQSFGGWLLGWKENHNYNVYCHLVVQKILETFEIDRWSDLKNIPARIIRKSGWNGKIVAIGHHYKDRWFDPVKEFNSK